MILGIMLIYELLDVVNIRIRRYIVYSVNNSISTCTASTIGTLEFRQREPLSVSQRKFFEERAEGDRLESQDLKFKESTTIKTCSTEDTDLAIQIKVHIPSQKIIYIPYMLEAFKFAWMQYMTFFLPVYAIIYFWILKVMYKNVAITAKIIEDIKSFKT